MKPCVFFLILGSLLGITSVCIFASPRASELALLGAMALMIVCAWCMYLSEKYMPKKK